MSIATDIRNHIVSRWRLALREPDGADRRIYALERDLDSALARVTEMEAALKEIAGPCYCPNVGGNPCRCVACVSSRALDRAYAKKADYPPTE